MGVVLEPFDAASFVADETPPTFVVVFGLTTTFGFPSPDTLDMAYSGS